MFLMPANSLLVALGLKNCVALIAVCFAVSLLGVWDAGLFHVSVVSLVVAAYFSIALPLLAQQKVGLVKQALLEPQEIEPGHLVQGCRGLFDLDIAVLESENEQRRGRMDHSDLVSEIGYSSSELSSTAEQLAANILQQSHATSSIAAAVTEISHSIEEIASRIGGAHESASHNACQSAEGLQAIGEVTAKMEAVTRLIDETHNQMACLSSKVGNISSISTVIREISEQTNLLALNAAIEAARAGEHGRGFAVVAEEVRALATRSYSSVQQIAENIDDVQSNMSAVTQSMDEVVNRTTESASLVQSAEQVFEKIVDNSQSVTEVLSAITEASSQQRQAASEISQSIEEVALVAEENSGKAEQVSRIASHLYQRCAIEGEQV